MKSKFYWMRPIKRKYYYMEENLDSSLIYLAERVTKTRSDGGGGSEPSTSRGRTAGPPKRLRSRANDARTAAAAAAAVPPLDDDDDDNDGEMSCWPATSP